MTGYCQHGFWRDACRDCDGRMLCINTICGNLVTRVGTQCTTCQPDFCFDVADEGRVVILEFDEHAHQPYVMSCELGRQGTVAVGYGGRPVHIIRYNPDNIPSDAWLKEVNRAQRERFWLVRLQAALVQRAASIVRQHPLSHPLLPLTPTPTMTTGPPSVLTHSVRIRHHT